MTLRPSLAALAASLALAACQHAPIPPPAPGLSGAPLSNDPAQRKAWVNDALANDFDFWRRYSNLPTDPFDRPLSWYSPNALVAGGIEPYFPKATGKQAGLSPAGFAKAADWAFQRKSNALIVLRDGRIEAERYAPGTDATAIMGAHSFSKALLSMLVGIAIQEGKIGSLDQPVDTWLTEWRDQDRGRITLRQLLTMTSGLATDPANIDPDNRSIRMIEGDKVDTYALSYQLANQPGSTFVFSNTDTQLAALVLERATGVKYPDYLSQKLWKPLGAQTGAVRLDKVGGDAIAFCCVLASPSDFVRIGQMLLNDGKVATKDGMRQVLPAGWVAEMKKPSAANPRYGLNVWLGSPYMPERKYRAEGPGIAQSEPYSQADTWFMDGGAHYKIWLVPSKKLAIVRTGSFVKDWDDAFIPNAILDGLR